MLNDNGRENILEVKSLKMHFPVRKGFFNKTVGYVKAVDDVSFSIENGKTFGLVGESGCGKTTVGKTILRINTPTSGEIVYKGQHIESFNAKQMAPVRRDIQMIFQDPYSSLDPRQSLGSILKEAIVCDGEPHEKEELEKTISELMVAVGLDPIMADRYPHELSGGQRQRLGIARALACNPSLIVCDEPVSALDVSIQAQVINLLRDLQEKRGLTYLFISHDLAVVKNIADTIAVMYLGHIVELMKSSEIYEHSIHPYTQALLSAVPVTDYYLEKKRSRIVLEGEVPSPINAPSGCPFQTRCKFASDKCRKEMPKLTERRPGHYVACYNV